MSDDGFLYSLETISGNLWRFNLYNSTSSIVTNVPSSTNFWRIRKSPANNSSSGSTKQMVFSANSSVSMIQFDDNLPNNNQNATLLYTFLEQPNGISFNSNNDDELFVALTQSNTIVSLSLKTLQAYILLNSSSPYNLIEMKGYLYFTSKTQSGLTGNAFIKANLVTGCLRDLSSACCRS